MLTGTKPKTSPLNKGSTIKKNFGNFGAAQNLVSVKYFGPSYTVDSVLETRCCAFLFLVYVFFGHGLQKRKPRNHQILGGNLQRGLNKVKKKHVLIGIHPFTKHASMVTMFSCVVRV